MDSPRPRSSSDSIREVRPKSYRHNPEYITDYLEAAISKIENHSIITWCSTQKLFIIHDRNRFEKEILQFFVNPFRKPLRKTVSVGNVYKQFWKRGFKKFHFNSKSGQWEEYTCTNGKRDTFALSHPKYEPFKKCRWIEIIGGKIACLTE